MAGLFRFRLFFGRKRQFILRLFYFTAEKVQSIFGRPLDVCVHCVCRSCSCRQSAATAYPKLCVTSWASCWSATFACYILTKAKKGSAHFANLMFAMLLLVSSV